MQTRTAGSVTSVEFHLVVPGRMAVEDVHKTCDRIEGAVRKDLGLVEDTPENDLQARWRCSGPVRLICMANCHKDFSLVKSNGCGGSDTI